MKRNLSLMTGICTFLSHLSGDEDLSITDLMFAYFLSHLSGDEGSSLAVSFTPSFLSHLSGDEELCCVSI